MKNDDFVTNDSIEYVLLKLERKEKIYRDDIARIIRENQYTVMPTELNPLILAALNGTMDERPGPKVRSYSDLRRLQAAVEFRVADIKEEWKESGWKRTRGDLTAKEQAFEEIALRNIMTGNSLRNLLSSHNLS